MSIYLCIYIYIYVFSPNTTYVLVEYVMYYSLLGCKHVVVCDSMLHYIILYYIILYYIILYYIISYIILLYYISVYDIV